ncbi:hypothetical protein HKX48_003748 [Thoreauomyces humboldtii]|nr:hypothetical protein HKX48_003748 [Thoreauomyces humboldtii]
MRPKGFAIVGQSPSVLPCNFGYWLQRTPVAFFLARRAASSNSTPLLPRHHPPIRTPPPAHCHPTSSRRLLASESSSSPAWETVIGLEVHAQLSTTTKLFSPAPLASNASPNTSVDPFDAAIPGSLPLLNSECVRKAVVTALALNSNVQLVSSFDRKHYFYGDLPAGYQVTQLWEPVARGGWVDVGSLDGLVATKANGDGEEGRRVRLVQIQIEQDSGKTVQGITEGQSLIDLNRAGVGVLEIITEPDLRSSEEVVAFLKKLQRLLWYIKVSAADMDEGAWRCDVNVSVRPVGGPLGVRTEIKHLVKFTSIKEAIEYEVERQIALLQSGKPVEAETRGFDARLGTTFRMRSKEDSQDYRFMPEPDLPQILLTNEYVENVRFSLPEPLDERRARLLTHYALPHHQVEILLDEPGAVEYFETVANGRNGKKAANWVVGELFGWLRMRDLKLNACPVEPGRVGELIDMVEGGTLSGLRAKDALHLMMDGDARAAAAIAAEKGWVQVNDRGELETLCAELIIAHPKEASAVRQGKERLIKFFVGEVMKKTKGKSNPVMVAGIFKSKLS